MDYTITAADAQRILSLFASFVAPFLISYFKRSTWTNAQKFALAALVCGIGGVLSTVIAALGDASGVSVQPLRILEAIIMVFSFSTIHYQTWFKTLGIEYALAGDAHAPVAPVAPNRPDVDAGGM